MHRKLVEDMPNLRPLVFIAHSFDNSIANHFCEYTLSHAK